MKVLNPAPGAFTDSSPLLVIAGAPGCQERQKYSLLLHNIRENNDQLNMFKQITMAAIDLKDQKTAYQEIDRVIAEVITERRPRIYRTSAWPGRNGS